MPGKQRRMLKLLEILKFISIKKQTQQFNILPIGSLEYFLKFSMNFAGTAAVYLFSLNLKGTWILREF